MFNVKRWERQECQNILPYISNVKRRKRHYFERVEIRTCHIINQDVLKGGLETRKSIKIPWSSKQGTAVLVYRIFNSYDA